MIKCVGNNFTLSIDELGVTVQSNKSNDKELFNWESVKHILRKSELCIGIKKEHER